MEAVSSCCYGRRLFRWWTGLMEVDAAALQLNCRRRYESGCSFRDFLDGGSNLIAIGLDTAIGSKYFLEAVYRLPYTARQMSALTPGLKLGSYEIVSLIGAGGMGEVYRARDSKLKRDVAIKVLPDEFSRDHDRVSRFQREAEVLASLNHSEHCLNLRSSGS